MFIGSIIAGFIAPKLQIKLTKKRVYAIGTLIVILGLLPDYFLTKHNYEFIFGSAFILGFGLSI